DTTAVALAAVLKHDGAGDAYVGCEIYTDVDGVYTTDPRPVPEARKMDFISYDEMLELASAGAAVMHSRSIEFAKKYDVPLMVRSSLSDAEGTWIVPEAEWMRQQPVCGVALVREEARLLLDGVPDIPGVSHRVFATLAEKNIVVDMIAQGVGSGGKAAIGFTVPQSELMSARRVLDPLVAEWGAKLQAGGEGSKILIGGAGMRAHTGGAEKKFSGRAPANINMQMITTGDIKISILVDKKDGMRAVRAAHQAFALHQVHATPDAKSVSVKSAGASNGKDLYQRLSSMEDILVSSVRAETGYGQI